MYVSYEKQLRFLDSSRFEELCFQIVKAEHIDAYHPEGSGGDNGIDIAVGKLSQEEKSSITEPLRVWQVKAFNYRIGYSQRTQIIRSLDKVIENHYLSFWTLCLTFNLTIKERQWFENLKQSYEKEFPGLKIEGIWDASEIISRCIEKKLLKNYFFTPCQEINPDLIKKIVTFLDSFDYCPGSFVSLSDKEYHEAALEFYNGTIPSWTNIEASHDAHRSILEKIWKTFVTKGVQREFSKGSLPIAILTGGAMSGKSTALMRLAIELKNSGFHVFWQKSDRPSLKADQIIGAKEIIADAWNKKVPIYILIDGLGYFSKDDVRAFLTRLHQESVPAALIATSLTTLGINKSDLNDLGRLQVFSMDQIEKEDIIELLYKYSETSHPRLQAIKHLSLKDQVEYLYRKKAESIGIVLLELKHNQELDTFVLNEFDRIVKEYGTIIKNAILYVCAFHRYDLGIPVNLLKTILNVQLIENDVIKPCLDFLSLDETKNTVIARHSYFSEIIFSNRTYQDGKEIYQQIISHAKSGGIEDNSVYFMLKRMSASGNDDLVYRLLKEQSDLNSPILLYLMGDYYYQHQDLENARAQLAKALKITPGDVRFWLKRGHIEAEAENIGNIEKKESARWFFFQATKMEDKQPSITWHQWGRMEKINGEIGYADASKPYTARWLFRQATEIDSHNPFPWISWAELEQEKNNLGSPKEKKTMGGRDIYTARYLLAKACHIKNIHPSVWRKWAMIETEEGNYGKDRNEIFTARWLYNRLLDNDPYNSRSWQGAAILERRIGNIGAGIADKDSARWMFYKGISANPRDAETLAAWGKMEDEESNIGTREKPDQYSARWLFRQATDVDPGMSYSWTCWAYLEDRIENYGTQDSEGTARYLYKKATECSPENYIIWSKWAQLEEKLHCWEKAESLYINAAKVQNKNSKSRGHYYANAARMAGNEGRIQSKIKHYISSLDAYEPNSIVHKLLGKTYKFVENDKKAEQHINRAMKLNPDDSEVRKYYYQIKNKKYG